MGNDTTVSRGREAEDLAAAYLERQGLRILARNFRVRSGELDLICQDGKTCVFVEVRLRKHTAWGGALESIDYRKRQRLLRAAGCYMQRLPPTVVCRFDCVLMSSLSEEGLEWIRDAFDAEG